MTTRRKRKRILQHRPAQKDETKIFVSRTGYQKKNRHFPPSFFFLQRRGFPISNILLCHFSIRIVFKIPVYALVRNFDPKGEVFDHYDSFFYRSNYYVRRLHIQTQVSIHRGRKEQGSELLFCPASGTLSSAACESKWKSFVRQQTTK